MTPTETVEKFIQAWNDLDMATAFSLMADDIVWEDVPHGAVQGIPAVQEKMASFPPMEGCEFINHHIAANGNVVLTERTDKFLAQGKWRAIRVSGTFEVDDSGKIAKWRDYFDSAAFDREFGDLQS